MSDSTFGFIGLGLIGGSIARGLRRANKDITIMAYMRTRSKLEQAKKEGTIDIILDGIDETLSACDIIFLCTPVEYNAMYLEKVRPFLKPGAIITDIGSTKTDIHKAVERLGYEDVFVGGHPMAAGLSMEEKNVELFRRRLNDNCTLTEQDLIPKIMIDVPMPISYLSKKLTEQLKVLEPFGKGNSKPLFAQKNLRAVGIRVLGRNRNVAKMLLIDENGIKMDAVYFGEAQEFVDFVQAHDTISVTYYPEINVFQGRENLQVVIKNYC